MEDQNCERALEAELRSHLTGHGELTCPACGVTPAALVRMLRETAPGAGIRHVRCPHANRVPANHGGSPVFAAAVLLECLNVRRSGERPVYAGLRGVSDLLHERLRWLHRRLLQDRVALTLDDEELAVAALCLVGRCVPLGTYYGLLSSIPRRILLQVRPPDAARVLYYCAIRMRGRGPVLEVHLPKLQRRHLTQADVLACHVNAAALMSANEHIRGLYSASWYYDPEVGRLSPHLQFLSEFNHMDGMLVVPLVKAARPDEDALCKSATRRAAYQAGSYRPMTFARLWARSPLLGWGRARCEVTW